MSMWNDFDNESAWLYITFRKLNHSWKEANVKSLLYTFHVIQVFTWEPTPSNITPYSTPTPTSR
jgi:hypothetical protein